MQEITGAKPVRDANSGLERWSNGLLDCAQQCEGFHSLIQYSANPSLQFCPARGSRGIADPPDLGSGSLGRASRLAPTTFNALKALSAMHSLGKRLSPVQLRVRAPLLVAVCQGGRPQGPQSSQRSSWFHKPAPPRAALGIATIFASMSRCIGTDRFCKAILPEHHRLEDPISPLA